MDAPGEAKPDLWIIQEIARRLGLDIDFVGGAWWSALAPGQRYDLALSNPPYIAEGDPHLPALRHEPRGALTAGPDGLDALREIVAGAPRHLRPAGWLLLEHGCDQEVALRALLAGAGFESIRTLRDASGLPRVTLGRRPE